ncbi:hypothetical protein ENSA5_02930 [Enhygromyxa salina]|uniref:Uncharacterized protein n=1 Tax=Enhygromyxa salina TaxID=215803 RepID=A0A2S9YJM2_9BACT|nr:hypothetical protein [Enhygromyxa salina]PRQ05303.1 hypothetical protein ENSA5_02930 [Enhygromyxa salina]
MTLSRSTLVVFILPTIGLLAAGCQDPLTADTKPICTPLEGEDCPTESEEGETSGGETGGNEDPGEMASDYCRHNPSADDAVGIQYQCLGDLYSSLDFTFNGDSCVDLLGAGWCEQYDGFGVGFQPYAAAEVIACCGEYDAQYADEYRRFCTYDMYQQLCITLSERLQAGVLDGSFGVFADEVAAVQVWIAQHYAECFTSLQNNNSAALPEVVSHWEIGDFGELHDLVLRIEAPTKIDGLSLPQDESEWLSCTDAQGNNDQIFEDGHTPKGGVVAGVELAASLGVELIGPSILGGTVTASAIFDAGCTPRGCAAAEFSYDNTGSQFTIEELDLFEDDPVIITNGIASLVADRVQVRLWGQAEGYEVGAPLGGAPLGYEIPAGAALFMISGLNTDGGSNRFIAANSTDIWISETRGTWTIGSFEITFEDGSGELWTVTIEDSQWDG